MLIKSVGIHPFGHDSSLVQINENQNNLDIYAEATERITRQKHDVRPVFSIKFFNKFLQSQSLIVIGNCESKKSQILFFDILSWLNGIYFYKLRKKKNLKKIFGLFRSLAGYFVNLAHKLFNSTSLFNHIKSLYTTSENNVEEIQHHYAHALTAFHTCPKSWNDEDILCVTIDGQGDKLCASVHEVIDSELYELVNVSKDASLCNIFAMATKSIGFVPNADEGKLEALACYAQNPKKHLYEDLAKSFFIDQDSLEIKVDKFNLSKVKLKVKKKIYLKSLSRTDFAWNMQQFFEDFYLEWVEKLSIKYKKNRIALSGGGTANVKLNRRIFESKNIKSIHIFPAMGDDGVAFGAAIYPFVNTKYSKSFRNLGLPYWGYLIKNEEAENTANLLDKNFFNIKKHSLDELADLISQKINDGKIGSICRDSAEFGPRALGNRSIVASPVNKNVRDRINKSFKKRDWFQPFCPIIDIKACPKYLKNWYVNKHMTCAFTVNECAFKDIPSCVHVDGTARAQILCEGDNILLNLIMSNLENLGHPQVILNTSFNLHGRSMVRTSIDALNDFLDCDLDFMVLGDIFIERKR